MIDAWDFGTAATGVPSTNQASPTDIKSMVTQSSILCNTTFAAPFGVVENIT